MSARILIVEDDEMIREMLHITLRQGGHSVTAAASGEAALDLLKRMRFDLVLLDVHMPSMSGLDVLTSMMRTGRPSPPVLMVTADRQADTVTGAMRLGCVGYVAKPFKPADLLERIARVLRGRAAMTVEVLDI